jgi:branched-chain amino acid transport system permease protein
VSGARSMLVAAVAAAALYFAPLFIGTLGLRKAIEILYLGLFAVSFNLLFGYAGLLSFGFNATFGLAGYGLALFLIHVPGVHLLLAILAVVLMTAAAGALIGALCVRLHGGYFSLLTLAVCQLLYAVAVKWRGITRGDDGIIVPPAELGLPFLGPVRLDIEANMYWFALTAAILCIGVMWRFTHTPLGQAVLLVRENSERAEFLGYHSYGTKVAAFTLASTMAGVGGILFALFQRLVSPSVLSLSQGGEVLFMTVLGGSGMFLGPLLGTAVYVLLQDWLSRTTEHWQFFIGLIFVLLVMFAPGGIAGLLRDHLMVHRRRANASTTTSRVDAVSEKTR